MNIWSTQRQPLGGVVCSASNNTVYFSSSVIVFLMNHQQLHIHISLTREVLYLPYNMQHCYIIQRESTPPPWGFEPLSPKLLGIFRPNFTRLLCIPITLDHKLLFNYLQL